MSDFFILTVLRHPDVSRFSHTKHDFPQLLSGDRVRGVFVLLTEFDNI